MFRITSGKGFHIRLPNGITISTQFGGGNYCGNYNKDIFHTKSNNECADAEVAVWNDNNDWITRWVIKQVRGEDINDDVVGHIGIDEWLKILDVCRELK
jgi:hypothetical protein